MAQGEFFKDYANACLKTGRCKEITFWGLDDNHTWYDGLFTETKPNLPLLIDEEGYMKPAWLGVRDAFESSYEDRERSSAWRCNSIFSLLSALSFICSLYGMSPLLSRNI
mmetsp:Transcript_21827/g.39338  ORF Transcript_21827/g.39338 Transcript_21827/m.39338 type:complete len:110 (+) Transcript_21827:472-801(+)